MTNQAGPGAVSSRFSRLIRLLLRGELRRQNVFAAWELRVLLDLTSHRLIGKKGQRTLLKYRLSALRELEERGGLPMTLSEYLENERLRRLARRRQST